ncbi:MAG TPA: HAD family hydrolase, partial [Propionibacteriaceae bacterium]|nr:HAD family hydrolase [Propionibacteriaceae bacterium]
MSPLADQDWRPRLVALDIDGTLVDRNGFLPDSVAEAVAQIVQVGVPVVLSTGRSWHGTRPLFEELQLPPGPTVCSNGAVVVRYPPQEIVRAITFDPRPVITRVEEFAPGTLIAVEEIGIGYRLNDRFPGEDLTGELIIEDAEQLSSQPVTRVILRDSRGSEEEFLALARHLGMHGVTYFIGWGSWIDIAPDGVNKATALAEVAAGFGVAAADVLAFGDGQNDI